MSILSLILCLLCLVGRSEHEDVPGQHIGERLLPVPDSRCGVRLPVRWSDVSITPPDPQI